jgi:hypothetical protein
MHGTLSLSHYTSGSTVVASRARSPHTAHHPAAHIHRPSQRSRVLDGSWVSSAWPVSLHSARAAVLRNGAAPARSQRLHAHPPCLPLLLPREASRAGTQAECYQTPTVGSLGLGGGGDSAIANSLPMLGVRGASHARIGACRPALCPAPALRNSVTPPAPLPPPLRPQPLLQL